MAYHSARMDRLEWFPLYHNDWIGDDKLTLCGLAAQGMLMRLMCKAWRRGARLFVDEEEFKLIAGCDLEEANATLRILQERKRIDLSIDEVEGVKMYSIFIPRLYEVYSEQRAKHERAFTNGSAAQATTLAEVERLMPDVLPAVKHRTTPKEAAILSKHSSDSGVAASGISQEKVAAISSAMKALTSTGRVLGMSLGGGLRDRWAKTLMEAFTTASLELKLPINIVAQSFVTRLRDGDVREKLRTTTWVRPEYLKTDWPQYVSTSLIVDNEQRHDEMSKRIERFYRGIKALEKDHPDIDPAHKAESIRLFWDKIIAEFRIGVDKLRTLGYEPYADSLQDGKAEASSEPAKDVKE